MEHPIIVVSEAPLKNILTNPDATGQVSQWAINLIPRDITYVHRTAIKSQVIPDSSSIGGKLRCLDYLILGELGPYTLMA